MDYDVAATIPERPSSLPNTTYMVAVSNGSYWLEALIDCLDIANLVLPARRKDSFRTYPTRLITRSTLSTYPSVMHYLILILVKLGLTAV